LFPVIGSRTLSCNSLGLEDNDRRLFLFFSQRFSVCCRHYLVNGSWTWQEEGTDYEETERVELLQVPVVNYIRKCRVFKSWMFPKTRRSLREPVAKFLIPDWWDKVDSGIGFSYRPARLHGRLAGQYNNPMPESRVKSQGLWIGLLEVLHEKYCVFKSKTKNVSFVCDFFPLSVITKPGSGSGVDSVHRPPSCL
jgi:hypothetical protein